MAKSNKVSPDVVKYPNPNPLTADKIKPGLVFGWWDCARNRSVGQYRVIGDNSFLGITESGKYLCNIRVLESSKMEFFTGSLVSGVLFLEVVGIAGYCIIKEAPEESEVKS